MDLKVERKGDIKFTRFIQAQSKIGNYIVSEVSKSFSDYVRNKYLSGQVLGVISGETKASTKFFKQKTGVFGIRPGVGIRGSKNYLSGLSKYGYSFMNPAFNSFKTSGLHKQIIEKIYSNSARKRLGGLS